MNDTKQFTQDEILEMLRTSASLQRAQLLAEGMARIIAATETHMTVGMLAFAHMMVEPLSRCVSPTGPDGSLDVSKKPVMIYDLPHERILREALQLYLAKQSAIVAAKDHGVDLLEREARRTSDTPGKCSGCGATVSANRQKCKVCSDADPEQGTASSIASKEPVQ